MNSHYITEWSRTVLGVTFRYTRRKPGGMGRFGAGWDWKIGVQWSGRCVLLSLLVAQLMISWPKKVTA